MSFFTRPEVFMAVFLITLAYVLSVARLELAVRAMKRQGKLPDAPRLFHAPGGFSGIVWLLGGRFERLGEEGVARWARIARILFWISAPLVFLTIAVNGFAILWRPG